MKVPQLTMRTDTFRTVSIIIPARNEANHLEGCLNSLLQLDYPRDLIEILVVDNGSTDKTREIAARLGAMVLRDDHLLVSGLRNLGAHHAKGEFLAFVDADCVVASDWLKSAAAYFDAAGLIAWGAPPVPPPDSTWVQRAWFLIRSKEEIVQRVEWLESMNLFVDRERFLAAGGFNESLQTCEDVDLCYRLSTLGSIVSDSRIHVIHHGEARTLREFIGKEFWRGRSNLSGLRSHGLARRELPSLAVPVYFGLFLPVLALAALLTWHPAFFFALIIASLVPSAAVLVRMRKKRLTIPAVLGLLVLLQIYFFARTLSIIK
jgi:glycosyltransferase involved in cell wall biosynthesis